MSVSPGCVGTGLDLPGSLSVGGVLRPQALHSIRWCLSRLWHTWQGHSGT